MEKHDSELEDYEWEKIIRLEPRLKQLYKEACRIKDDRQKASFCANAFWYGYHGNKYAPNGLRGRLKRLVGFGTEVEGLRNLHAHSVAYDKVYKVLPPCRNCGCL